MCISSSNPIIYNRTVRNSEVAFFHLTSHFKNTVIIYSLALYIICFNSMLLLHYLIIGLPSLVYRMSYLNTTNQWNPFDLIL